MKEVVSLLEGKLSQEKLEPSEEDIAVINRLPNPPLHKISKQDIYIRRCRLASDAVDCGYGRFRTEDLPHLLELVQGVSMLVGHRKDRGAVARFFGGTIEELSGVYNPYTKQEESVRYIVPKFYWMKSHSRAEDLRVNIDGGIYHQVSLSWWYKEPTCGICGGDIRRCEHVPGREYDGRLAHYWYDRIGGVLEGSIVFSGGQPFTGFHLNARERKGFKEYSRIYLKDTASHILLENRLKDYGLRLLQAAYCGKNYWFVSTKRLTRMECIS